MARGIYELLKNICAIVFFFFLVCALVVTIMQVVNTARAEVPDVSPHAHDKYHAEFYSKLRIPDKPHISCCNQQDCKPTKHRFLKDGTLEMQFEGRWFKPPSHRVMTKITPDGAAHLCALPSGVTAIHVFCAIVPFEAF